MKNKELFNRTVSVLVKAYLKGTLKNASCAACAVGNLILASNNLEPVNSNGNLEWPHEELSYCDKGISWYSVLGFEETPNEYINSINKTGYSWEELGRIENAFENVRTIAMKDRMFHNMMSVVDCLMEIHEANEIEIKEAKSLFVKETA